jgi:hypothetical protein
VNESEHSALELERLEFQRIASVGIVNPVQRMLTRSSGRRNINSLQSMRASSGGQGLNKYNMKNKASETDIQPNLFEFHIDDIENNGELVQMEEGMLSHEEN